MEEEDEKKQAKKSLTVDKLRRYEASAGNQSDLTKSDADKEKDPNSTFYYNPTGYTEPGGDRTQTAGNESSRAESPEEEESDPNQSYYKPSTKKKLGSKAKKITKSVSKKKKWVLIGGGGGGAFVIIALLLVFVASLLIPGFEQNIIDWQFARVARSFADDSAEITDEKLALDAASPAEKASIEKEINAQSDSTLKEIEGYNPETVEDALAETGSTSANGLLDTTYNSSGQLTDITQDGQTDTITNSSKTPNQFFGQEHGATDFATDSGTDLTGFENGLATNTDGISTVIRGPINEGEILPSLGIELVAWTPDELANYSKDNPIQAEAELEQDAYNTIDDADAIGSAVVSQDNSDAAAAHADEIACVQNKDCVDTIVANDGEEPAVVAADLTADTASSWWTKALGFISPAQAIALPACIIYDGSVDNSGNVMDAQDKEEQRAGYLVDSAGDQQKSGHTNAQAVGAFNWKLGHVDQSIPEERQAGEVVDTSSELSPQTGPSGTYSLFNVWFSEIGFPSWVAGIFNGGIKPSCQALTSPVGVVTTAVINVIGSAIADVFSGGGATAAEESADLTAQEIISQVASNVFARLTDKAALKGIVTGTFSKETLGKAAVIAGATLLSKLIVLESMGATANGLSTNAEFDNEADAGNNLNANQLEQLQFYGRPLTNTEVAASRPKDTAYLASLNSKKSLFQRYFAISNSDSLISRVATTLTSTSVKSFFGSMFSKIGDILQPLSWVSKLPFIAKASAVAPNIDNQDYGIVQWGWSAPEESLIKSDPSYQPIENQMILDKSGQEASIANTYGVCYSIKETMGDLLSSGLIQRDSNADVVPDAGTCSPCNLTYNNPTDIACPPNNDPNNLVFRWRIAQAYDSTMQQLTDIQTNAPAPSK